MAKFSVLISIYCKERPSQFDEALASVFGQTRLPDEVVVVKDGPLTAELDAVIDRYSSRYPIFKIVENRTNLGLGLALARGVEHCSYEYIARMDTDDIIPTDRFEKQLAVIEQGFDVVDCWSQIFIDNPDNVIAVKYRPEHHDDIVKLAHKRSPICHAAAFMRKSKVLEAGNYKHRPMYEDYHLWVRMIMNGAKFHNIQETLYYVRTNEEQIARRRGLGYLKTELACMKEFYDMGFYTMWDLCRNSAIRVLVRLLPQKLMSNIFKIIWNHTN